VTAVLANNSFSSEYVASCRARIDRQVAAFREAVDDLPQDLSVAFCNNLVVVLEGCFVHRTRGREAAKDSALKRLRDLASAIVASADQDPVSFGLDEFEAFANEVFAEIEDRFSE
jgi:hypothetical protein